MRVGLLRFGPSRARKAIATAGPYRLLLPQAMANEHDLRYKLLFSHRIIVQRLLEGFIDEPFVRRIDFDTLREEKTNTISDDEQERESDVIWSVRVGETRLYIYILIEFQSTVDPWMPLRFSRYVQRFYDVWEKNHPASDGLPPMLPVLLYNGSAEWTAKTSLQEMVHRHISPKYILSLHYLPIIIRGIPRKKLARIHNAGRQYFWPRSWTREVSSRRLKRLLLS